MDEDEQVIGGGGPMGFSWENRYAQSWEILQEDAEGTLDASLIALRTARYIQRRRDIADRVLKRGLLRNLCVLIDGSKASIEQDYSPSRAKCLLNQIMRFSRRFFEQNPLSQLGVVTMAEGTARSLSGLTGNVRDVIERLPSELSGVGEASVQNGLEVARNLLAHVPGHGTREVLILFCGVSTSDIGDLAQSIVFLQSARIRVSCISLSGELFALRRICSETGGRFAVPLNEPHLTDLLNEFISPPELLASEKAALSYLVPMGFPARIAVAEGVCSCHGKPMTSSCAFFCPRCQATVCQVPSDCPLCGLTLVTAPYLAKSYHHLFPTPLFTVIKPGTGSNCFACHTPISASQCPRCSKPFCEACDLFVHDSLMSCPGCM